MGKKDDFPILGIHHIELYVGSVKQMAYYLCNAFGFREIAYADLETGESSKTSRVLAQGDIRLVLTGALCPESKVARHVAKHGDGVKDIALCVPDADKAYERVVGLTSVIEKPKIVADQYGKIVSAKIDTYGDTVHSLIDSSDYKGVFLPGFSAVDASKNEGVGLINIDHIVGNVELGKMNYWADYYARIMGFTNLVHYDDDAICTEYSALMSKVMWDGVGKVKFPINEPAEGRKGGVSQIQEYLDFYRGPGVQHIALQTENIVKTVSILKERDVEFLEIPSAYYDEVREKFKDVNKVDVDALERLGVLADRDEDGYLLQIFTKPIVDRPTLFFEIIERHGSRGFGLGNFKSLFEAMERDQKKRGTLLID
jgi:4-hydroxyphenylpyruvate dioxygenase